MPWTAQVFETEVYVQSVPAASVWGEQVVGSEVYTSQEPPSPLVYALDGEQVFALNGSPVQFGYFWINQATENIGWTDQVGG
jgi:hypothetical protein